MWMAGLIGQGGGNKAEPIEEDDHDTPWTLAEVQKYNGKQEGGKIYISCNGRVFDVTDSPNY